MAAADGDSGIGAGPVDSLLHPASVLIRRLLSRSERETTDKILIDDEENIIEAIRAGVKIEALFHAGDERVSAAVVARLSRSTPILEVAKRTCKKLFESERMSRQFAIARRPPALPLSGLAGARGDIVALEGVAISGNIGAIVRTCAALKVGTVVLLNVDPVDVYDRRLIRASRGYIFSLPVATATTANFVEFCDRQRLPLYTTSPSGDVGVTEIAVIAQRIVLAFGSEKTGCSPALDDRATARIQIPTDPAVESLNVSAAAAITLHHRYQFASAGGR